jgi:hypothetical protein
MRAPQCLRWQQSRAGERTRTDLDNVCSRPKVRVWSAARCATHAIILPPWLKPPVTCYEVLLVGRHRRHCDAHASRPRTQPSPQFHFYTPISYPHYIQASLVKIRLPKKTCANG